MKKGKPQITQIAQIFLNFFIICVNLCNLWAFFIAPGSHLWALDPGKPVDQYLVDQWETSAGVPSNTILSINQTPDGYLWIATTKGLVRFDGIEFSIISFSEAGGRESQENPIPESLFVDRQGTLWIGSSAGLTSFHQQTGQFHTYTPAYGISKDRIRRIKDDIRGDLWISFFTSYVNRFSAGKFTPFNAVHGLKGNKINAIVECQNGNLLFGSRENGVFIYREGKFLKYPVPGLEHLHLIDMVEDKQGSLWIGTNNGLFRVTGQETKMYTAGDGLSNDYVTSIMEDSDGNTWVGTLKGLNRLGKKPDGAIGFESVLNSQAIVCLFEDREKSLWVGTYDSGIKRIKEGKFTSYQPVEQYPEEIFLSLLEDRSGDTWIGTLSGKLFRCRGSKIIEIIESPAISGAGITAIAEDADENLWLGTNGRGVFQKKSRTFSPLTTREGLADNLVTSIFKDSKGNLWISTFAGVSIIHHSNGFLETFASREGLSGKVVHNVYEDERQNILIAADKGVTVLKQGKIAKENIEYVLPGVPVTCIYQDHQERSTPGTEGSKDQVIWLATHGAGLKRLQKENIISFTTANGMTTDFIYQFFEDQQGNFWLMSDSGILRVSKSELNRVAAGQADVINCAAFGISEGMKSIELNNEFSRHSALKTRKGEFWFITQKNISIIDPGKIQINKVPPPVVIDAVLFDDQQVPLHREAPEFYGKTDFQFHFTAPTFLSPGKVKFKYRLQGFDRGWVFLGPGRERTAQYKNLEPGTYTFRVIACNAEGIWNRTGASITFTLKPFFYETLLFKIVILFMLVAIGTIGLYIYKKRPFKKQEKYKDSPLNSLFAEECIRKLKHLMEVEKAYLDADISLQSLAEKLSITSRVLSQVLNEKMDRNFSDFINFYRVEEAKKILMDPRSAQKKIIALAFDVGFNTKVAFYNAFKKFTHMTPAQYREKLATESKKL
jgi:ligand-binding sensor domain-containing protein/AraC-like DNA-binding protein